MAYQSQDIIRRSATNGLTPAPQARDFQEEVAKLIDVTTCIGCKACEEKCPQHLPISQAMKEAAEAMGV